MKKTILSVLSIAIILCMNGCGKAEQKETTEVTTTTTIETTEATTTTTEATTETTEKKTTWQVGNTVDDFGDPTENYYMYITVPGKFSNTATANEDLTAIVYFIPWIASNDRLTVLFSFRLLEHNNHPATYTKSDEYTLKYKIGDEIFKEKLITSPPNGDLYIINKIANGPKNEAVIKIHDALENGEVVRVIIESRSSKYEFEINGEGWQDSAQKIKELYKISSAYGI